MFFEAWYYPLLRNLFECTASVALGTGLVRVRYTFWQILAAGAVTGLFIFIVQRLPIQFGMHIPLGVIIYTITLNLLLKLNILKSAAAALISYVFVILIEILTMYSLVNVFGYPEETIMYGPDLTKFLFSLPPLALLLILAAGAQVWLRLRVGDGSSVQP